MTKRKRAQDTGGGLRYVGPRNGKGEPSGFFGIPARDLTAAEAAAAARLVPRNRLIASGLYAPLELEHENEHGGIRPAQHEEATWAE